MEKYKYCHRLVRYFPRKTHGFLHGFVIFDIKDFYASIKEKLLIKALKFAEPYTDISDEDKRMINHSRKSLLFNNQQAWIKKESGLFDVTMGAYDGAEVCELVGSFLLHQLSKKYNKKDIGLYRDDGLAVFKNKSGPQAERIKKDFQKIFRENDLNIVIKCNLKTVNYLDVTLKLLNNTYKPFCKPNNEINYIHKESNHPLSIIKQVSFLIELRLSSLSSNEKIFNESTPIYQEALKKSGYGYKLKY